MPKEVVAFWSPRNLRFDPQLPSNLAHFFFGRRGRAVPEPRSIERPLLGSRWRGAPSAGSGNSGPTISVKSGPLKGSDNLPTRTPVDPPRRREAKGDDRSHGQTSGSSAARRRQDAAADRDRNGDPAAHREADRAGASDRGARGRGERTRARRGPTERGRGVSRPDRRRARG